VQCPLTVVDEVTQVSTLNSYDTVGREIAKEPAPRPSPPNALSAPKRVAVLALLSEPGRCDLAVDQGTTTSHTERRLRGQPNPLSSARAQRSIDP